VGRGEEVMCGPVVPAVFVSAHDPARWRDDHGQPPTARDVGGEQRVQTRSVPPDHLEALLRGYGVQLPGRSRTRLNPQPADQTDEEEWLQVLAPGVPQSLEPWNSHEEQRPTSRRTELWKKLHGKLPPPTDSTEDHREQTVKKRMLV